MAFVITGSVTDEKKYPTAVAVAEPETSVIGAVVRLNGFSSSDPEGLPLTYSWSFFAVPVGSSVVQEGFRKLSDDGALVSFSPDVVGEYSVRLTVSNGLFTSTDDRVVSIRAILVPHGRGLIPDGKFVWSYIRDVWQGVENKEWFETLWSALIQIAGAEMLKLYQVDFSKSIRDIQDLMQRRWLAYETELKIDDTQASLWLGNCHAGTSATTKNLGLDAKAVVLSKDNIVIIKGAVLPNVYNESLSLEYSQDSNNIGSYRMSGLNQAKNGYSLVDPVPFPNADRLSYIDEFAVEQNEFTFDFDFQSTKWSRGTMDPLKYAERLSMYPDPPSELIRIEGSGLPPGANLRIGDVVYYPSGKNAGFYIITKAAGTYIEVDRAPQGASTDNGTVKAQIYRPVPVRVSQPASYETETFSVPLTESKGLTDVAAGRIISLGGRSFTILRATTDDRQEVPITLVMTDEGGLVTNLSRLPWRVPNMVESKTQNFEELGVSPGDLIKFDVMHSDTRTISEASGQVVCVLGNKLGFVLTDEKVLPGSLTDIPFKTYERLAADLSLDKVSKGPDGSLLLSGNAKSIVDYINLPVFQRKYFNTPITHETPLEILGSSFTIHVKSVIRNSKIPVDSTLRSIPALQEYIKQPTDGRTSVVLGENLDYVIDSGTAFSGEMTFHTGSSVLDVEGGHFIGRSLRPGDIFEIQEPAVLADTFTVVRVVSDDVMELSKPIPKYELADPVTAKVVITRGKTGSAIRFLPGTFTADNPAPPRLWAEVSFFDNSSTIEENFGILVGLSKSDLDSVSRDINYRQAVAGLMFAYTRGSSLNKLRLGAQILLGLPFAEHAGIVRSIEEDYRLDSRGLPTLGRLLIEDVDADDAPTGTLRVYTFPIDPQTTTLSGVEDNPATGKAYQVGDRVELFASLGKGVQALDYLTDPASDTMPDFMKLQQLHSFTLRVRDRLLTAKELELASKFLRRITPSYISYVVRSATEFRDQINIIDALRIAILNRDTGALVDTIGLHFPVALMFDSRAYNGPRLIDDDRGALYLRMSGQNMVTEAKVNLGDPTLVTIPNALLITPEYGEGPVVRYGDYLAILDGPDKGFYPITTIYNETTFEVDFPPGFQDGKALPYAVLRRVTARLRNGTAILGNEAAVDIYGEAVAPAVNVGGALVEDGLTADGVAIGDWFVADYLGDGVVYRHVITNIIKDGGTGAYNRLQVVPPFPGAMAAVDYRIYRPQLVSGEIDGPVSLACTGGVYSTDSYHRASLLDPGDELEVLGPPGFGALVVLDPKSLIFQPIMPDGPFSARIKKRGFPNGDPISFDSSDLFCGWDEVLLALRNPAGVGQIACTNTSADVPFDTDTGVLPGDALKITTGTNSTVDHGYGPGVYQIIEVQEGQVTLAHPLTATENVDWQLLRRR
jgi:hypothetical protein